MREIYDTGGFDSGTVLRLQLQELSESLTDHTYPVQQDELLDTYDRLALDVGGGTGLDEIVTEDVYASADDVLADIERYLSHHDGR